MSKWDLRAPALLGIYWGLYFGLQESKLKYGFSVSTAQRFTAETYVQSRCTVKRPLIGIALSAAAVMSFARRRLPMCSRGPGLTLVAAVEIGLQATSLRVWS